MTPYPSDEESILWLEDASSMPYIREAMLICTAKRGFSKSWSGDRVVAIAQLRSDVRGVNRRFARRAWVLRPNDPYPAPDYPSSARLVDTVIEGQQAKSGRRM